jgi:hypothetical protein
MILTLILKRSGFPAYCTEHGVEHFKSVRYKQLPLWQARNFRVDGNLHRVCRELVARSKGNSHGVPGD